MHTKLQARAAHNSANTISMTQTLRALWREGSRGMTAGIVPRICVRSHPGCRCREHAPHSWHGMCVIMRIKGTRPPVVQKGNTTKVTASERR